MEKLEQLLQLESGFIQEMSPEEASQWEEACPDPASLVARVLVVPEGEEMPGPFPSSEWISRWTGMDLYWIGPGLFVGDPREGETLPFWIRASSLAEAIGMIVADFSADGLPVLVTGPDYRPLRPWRCGE